MRNCIILLLVAFIVGCQDEKFKAVGNIAPNLEIDSPLFELCNESLIKEYYIRRSSDIAPNYKGEKRGLEKEILDAYSYPIDTSQNGYITIRFIINCRGESGRFRTEEMDSKLRPTDFEKGISSQLLNIVKGLNHWVPRKRSSGNKSYDFYQYLTFKIQNGQIIQILP